MEIKSEITLGKKLPSFTDSTLKNEPMFFNCSWNYAHAHGGIPTKMFLESLPKELQNENTIIDSRVHMLMPNWFPCIPGFHHDDVDRNTENGQPNYKNPSYRPKHALILFSGDVCPTEFAIGEAEFSNPEQHDIVYKHWHKEVIEKISKGELTSVFAPNNNIVYFDDRTWHQGTKALKNGWRLFIRASWETNRKPTNEIRRQVQVYLENPMEGW